MWIHTSLSLWGLPTGVLCFSSACQLSNTSQTLHSTPLFYSFTLLAPMSSTPLMHPLFQLSEPRSSLWGWPVKVNWALALLLSFCLRKLKAHWTHQEGLKSLKMRLLKYKFCFSELQIKLWETTYIIQNASTLKRQWYWTRWEVLIKS